MSFVSTKAKFHLALDGVGLILQGAPASPAYRMNNAPVYGTRFASGDRDYSDLSQWWYLTQTDWSGGFKNTPPFVDDAKFYYSSNIDARTKPGTIRLEREMELVFDNDANNNEIMGLFTSVQSGTGRTHFIDNSQSRNITGTVAWDSNSNPSMELGRGDYLWSFGDTVQNSSTAVPYPFVRSNKTSDINGIIDGDIDNDGAIGIEVGGTLYVLAKTTVNKISVVKTALQNPASGADWTLVSETSYGNSLGAKLAGAAYLDGQIIYLVVGEPRSGLYSLDIATGIVLEIYQFDGTTQLGSYYKGGRYVQPFQNGVLITVCKSGTDDEDGDIWKYDGTTLTKIWSSDEAKVAFSTREGKPWLRGGATIYGDNAFWGNLVYDGEHFFNFIKSINDTPSQVAIPVGTDGEYLYLVDNVVTGSDPQSQLYRYNKSGTIYKDGANNSAFLIFSQHDKLQSIDKLLNAINIGFEEFASGQSISIYYSLDPIPDPNITTGAWTLLGTASHTLDGATRVAKTFPFPAGIIAKKIWFRVELTGGGSNTPALTDLTLEYLPLPDYKKQWTLNVNCADDLKLLDGTLTEIVARELKSRLERMWWTKSQLDFQDLDYATTTVNDASFDATETTVTVVSTYDFPEQGRIRVDDEEILYTGKTPTTFTGCTRGARGTRAATHANSSVVNNAYRVIITDIEMKAPILLEDKNTEYVVGISLREV
jgi:hypothetical protein